MGSDPRTGRQFIRCWLGIYEHHSSRQAVRKCLVSEDAGRQAPVDSSVGGPNSQSKLRFGHPIVAWAAGFKFRWISSPRRSHFRARMPPRVCQPILDSTGQMQVAYLETERVDVKLIKTRNRVTFRLKCWNANAAWLTTHAECNSSLAVGSRNGRYLKSPLLKPADEVLSDLGKACLMFLLARYCYSFRPRLSCKHRASTHATRGSVELCWSPDSEHRMSAAGSWFGSWSGMRTGSKDLPLLTCWKSSKLRWIKAFCQCCAI